MKVRRSYRLDNLADAAIKRMALDGGISEAAVIESLALGGIKHVMTKPMEEPKQEKAILGIAPKGSFTKDDLKAMIAGKGPKLGVPEIDLQNEPHAPFDLNIEGEPHRVAQMGKGGLWLFYLSEGGNRPIRRLEPGELEAMWEKRHV